MAGIWQHRLVFAVQMGKDFQSWFNLPPVDGIRKDDKGGMFAYLKNVVILGLQREGISFVTIDGSWLCRDEEDRWWVLGQAEYAALDEECHVTLFPNEQTHRQAITIMAMNKMQREFDAMSPEEQEALYNKYPDFFTKIEV